MSRDIALVELRGLEPLTPTLPGAGGIHDQARYDHFRVVVGVVGRATVVRVVVTIVVSDPSCCGCLDEDIGRLNPVTRR
jgi:hypothetical protein